MSAPSGGGTGDFSQTPIKPESSWNASPQTGDFSYTYPIDAVTPAAGPKPDLALQYSSSSIDGETGVSNNQSSESGDGWTVGGGGYIESSYLPCNKDGGTTTDLCWQSFNATIAFGKYSERIVYNTATSTWKLTSDDGSRIEELQGAPNGAHLGWYWRLTTPDGTQYIFGQGTIPGDTAPTNSVLMVPVYGNNTGEPCHATSYCSNIPWRWNLDYVIDTHNNVEAFYYNK